VYNVFECHPVHDTMRRRKKKILTKNFECHQIIVWAIEGQSHCQLGIAEAITGCAMTNEYFCDF